MFVASTAGAAIAANLAHPWAAAAPAWVEFLGAASSTLILIVLSVINLRCLVRSDDHATVRPVGLLGRLVARLTQTAHPVLIALIGAMFALSFDTLSQALLFSATAVKFQRWTSALTLGVLFTLGMTLLDGLNGAWMARLLRSADQAGIAIARKLALAVSILGLIVAIAGAVRLFWARLDSILDKEAAIAGTILIAVLVLVSAALLVWPRTVERRSPHSHPSA
jgi:high-affinity nickel-transport protein